MKQHIYRVIALCLALCTLLAAAAFAAEEPTASDTQAEETAAVETEILTPEERAEEPAAPAEESPESYEYPDDWSREALIFAVENNILRGDHHQRLNPEKPITRAEMAAILVRMLGAGGSADLSAFTDVDANGWYYPELSAAVAAGIFTGSGAAKMEPNACLTREQAVVVLTRAFGIADTDRNYYTRFSDAKDISAYARNAVSAMAKQGFLNGYQDGGVHPRSSITRAEIAQLIFNLFDCILDTPEELPASGRVLYRGAQSLPDSLTLDGSLVIGQPYAGTLSPAGWNISGTLSVRCGSEVAADFTNLQAGQLVFAPAGGKLTASIDRTFLGGKTELTGSAKTLTLLNGKHTFTGSCDELVLYENAYLIMTGDVAGDIIAERASALVLHGGAASLTADRQVGLTVSGDVSKIVLGSKSNLHIYGSVDSITIGSGCSVTLEKDMDSIVITSDNVHLTLNCRVGKVSAEGRNITIDGSGSIGELSYYSSTTYSVPCDSTIDLWEKEFGRDYADALSTVKTLKIPCIAQRDTSLYKNSGSGYIGTIPKGTVVYNQYWPSGSYMLVSTSDGRRGWVNRYDFFIDVDNMSFDGNYDYSEGTKCGFVNLRGYSSETNYLIWISRYTQKVIIYTGSKGNWTVLKTFPCASGSAYTPTPEGIYDIYGKTWSWDFGSYIVTNVSLFNGGMAFHSYLLNHNGTDYYSALGRPMSHGCIRMKPADAAFIYNSIPTHTTVVVY